MYPFEYHRPDSVDEALEFYRAADEGLWLAGGMTLLPAMKLRLSAPSELIDLAGLDELRGIEVANGCIEIGAMTIHDAVARSELVRERIPALCALANGIGDSQVRNRGTIGGSVSNSDPAADYPAAVLALGATIKTSARTIAADDFFTGMFETSLEQGELIQSVRFPIPKSACYMKFPNPASRYAIVGVMVARFDDGVRVAVTGAGSFAFRVAEMENALAADFDSRGIADIRVASQNLNEDMHASAEYRSHLVTVMAQRAVDAAI
ncbi:MAG: FAD binding domain-containing protein [Gammaproteobacteria bacterium]